MKDITTILRETTRLFAASGSPSARLDAEVLLMRYLGIDRLELICHPRRELTADQEAGFDSWVRRRCQGEPVAYIVGEKEFWSLAFEVTRDVLIPRPETECLIEEVLKLPLPEAPRIAEVGTGSGAIAVALAREIPRARITATDISEAAIEVARRNAVRHGVADRIEFVRGDLFAGASGPFSLVVSNPPYIPETVFRDLPAGIREFEPSSAFLAGPDGLLFFRRLIGEGAERLSACGWLVMEFGEGQRAPLEDLFRQNGQYDTIRFRVDYGGADRVVCARRQGS